MNEEMDTVIRENFPDGWYVIDRPSDNEALLCRNHWQLGSVCICLRPKLMPTKDWLPIARKIAHALNAV